MIELIVAALALAATGASVWAVRRYRQSHGHEEIPALPPAESASAAASTKPGGEGDRAPRCAEKGELEPGDVIFHLGSDYLIEGVAILREGGRSVLVVARMHDEGDERFLVIDPDGAPRCVLGRRGAHGSGGHAVPNVIIHDEMEMRLSSRAAVRIFCQGDFGFPKDAACELGRYRGPGGRAAVMLLVEGQELLVAGRAVAEAGIELLQGDRARRSTS